MLENRNLGLLAGSILGACTPLTHTFTPHTHTCTPHTHTHTCTPHPSPPHTHTHTCTPQTCTPHTHTHTHLYTTHTHLRQVIILCATLVTWRVIFRPTLDNDVWSRTHKLTD